MESKRVHNPRGQDFAFTAFNRTSMESKLVDLGLCHELVGLLIEPVWNRNLFYLCLNAYPAGLLIEPVWNRNLAR